MTAKDFKNKLEAYPDDWPLAGIFFEPATICEVAKQISRNVTSNQVNEIIELINEYSKAAVDWNVVKSIIKMHSNLMEGEEI